MPCPVHRGGKDEKISTLFFFIGVQLIKNVVLISGIE